MKLAPSLAAGSEPPVWAIVNGVFPSNCYICGTGIAGECFIVDPGLDSAVIEEALARLALVPRAVLCTHGHFDHAGSAAHFQEAYGCKVFMHAADVKTLKSSNFLLMAFKIPARISTPAIHDVEDEGLVVTVGHSVVRFHPAPGHTPGSCILECGNSLFTGDTLYSRGVGLSKLPGEDAEQLRRSIRSLWNRFPADTVIRPGHGEAARFGWVKENNAALLRFLGAECEPIQQS